MGKGRRGNLIRIECPVPGSRLGCFTHIIPFNHQKDLMKTVFVLTFLDKKAETQRINFGSLTVIN